MNAHLAAPVQFQHIYKREERTTQKRKNLVISNRSKLFKRWINLQNSSILKTLLMQSFEFNAYCTTIRWIQIDLENPYSFARSHHHISIQTQTTMLFIQAFSDMIQLLGIFNDAIKSLTLWISIA